MKIEADKNGHKCQIMGIVGQWAIMVPRLHLRIRRTYSKNAEILLVVNSRVSGSLGSRSVQKLLAECITGKTRRIEEYLKRYNTYFYVQY